jgi:hypothetical protein
MTVSPLGTSPAQECPGCVGHVDTTGKATRAAVYGSNAYVAVRVPCLRVFPSLDDYCQNRDIFEGG